MNSEQCKKGLEIGVRGVFYFRFFPDTYQPLFSGHRGRVLKRMIKQYLTCLEKRLKFRLGGKMRKAGKYPPVERPQTYTLKFKGVFLPMKNLRNFKKENPL
jgi:hypothetical protein